MVAKTAAVTVIIVDVGYGGGSGFCNMISDLQRAWLDLKSRSNECGEISNRDLTTRVRSQIEI